VGGIRALQFTAKPGLPRNGMYQVSLARPQGWLVPAMCRARPGRRLTGCSLPSGVVRLVGIMVAGVVLIGIRPNIMVEFFRLESTAWAGNDRPARALCSGATATARGPPSS